MLERRSETRTLAVYRAAYVRSARGFSFVTMRNTSDSGAAFQGEIDLQIGERIEYCTGEKGPVPARVRWIGDRFFGVEDIQEDKRPVRQGADFAPRSVRLPIGSSVTIYLDGKRYCSELVNLSQFGACVFAPQPLTIGQLVSIEIGNQAFAAAIVRWAAGGRVGIKFAKPMSTSQINTILDLIGLEEQFAKPTLGTFATPDMILLSNFSGRAPCQRESQEKVLSV